jgi:hypothetical protein
MSVEEEEEEEEEEGTTVLLRISWLKYRCQTFGELRLFDHK